MQLRHLFACLSAEVMIRSRYVFVCRRLRKQGVLVTRSAGSDLIVALCKAEQPGKALRVYHDMMASAFGAPGDALL